MTMQNVSVTAKGTLSVNSYIQEDRMIWPGHKETIIHSPLVLEVENAETVFEATTSGPAGGAYRALFDALHRRALKMALIIDNADSAYSNVKHLRYLHRWIRASTPPGSHVLLRFARCDGHQLHLVASLALTRAKVASPLFSAAILLRVGTYKWRMRAALYALVQEDLEWNQGGAPCQSNRRHALFVLRKTIMRDLAEAGGDDDDQVAARRQRLQNYCDLVVDVLNGDWARQRIY